MKRPSSLELWRKSESFAFYHSITYFNIILGAVEHVRRRLDLSYCLLVMLFLAHCILMNPFTLYLVLTSLCGLRNNVAFQKL